MKQRIGLGRRRPFILAGLIIRVGLLVNVVGWVAVFTCPTSTLAGCDSSTVTPPETVVNKPTPAPHEPVTNHGQLNSDSQLETEKQTSSVSPQSEKPEPKPTVPPLAFTTPGFDDWAKAVAAMPAEQQVEAVTRKLNEINRKLAELEKANNPKILSVNFQDVEPRPTIQDGVVTDFYIHISDITDLSPVRAFVGLQSLRMSGSNVSDLSPLTGMQLKYLALMGSKVSDISPLKGMPLTKLKLFASQVTDLSPLKDMNLEELEFLYSPVSDLSPLKNMKFTKLTLQGTAVTDLSPLKSMPLTELSIAVTKVSDLSPLKGMKITSLILDETEVSDLSPLRNMPLTVLSCSKTKVSDLSPLTGMPLTVLLVSITPVADLSPLKNMPLTNLYCRMTQVSDLSPLKGMKLRLLVCDETKVTDFSPLRGFLLDDLICDFEPERDSEILRSIKTLKRINNTETDQFWDHLDTQKKLEKPR